MTLEEIEARMHSMEEAACYDPANSNCPCRAKACATAHNLSYFMIGVFKERDDLSSTLRETDAKLNNLISACRDMAWTEEFIQSAIRTGKVE